MLPCKRGVRPFLHGFFYLIKETNIDVFINILIVKFN